MFSLLYLNMNLPGFCCFTHSRPVLIFDVSIIVLKYANAVAKLCEQSHRRAKWGDADIPSMNDSATENETCECFWWESKSLRKLSENIKSEKVPRFHFRSSWTSDVHFFRHPQIHTSESSHSPKRRQCSQVLSRMTISLFVISNFSGTCGSCWLRSGMP